MKCPYCDKMVLGVTGFQEASAFQKHLGRCRKNPNNIVIRDGKKTVVEPLRNQTFDDALRIREESGQ